PRRSLSWPWRFRRTRRTSGPELLELRREPARSQRWQPPAFRADVAPRLTARSLGGSLHRRRVLRGGDAVLARPSLPRCRPPAHHAAALPGFVRPDLVEIVEFRDNPLAALHPFSSVLARSHEAEQETRYFPLLDFLAAFGDTVAAMMAIDVFERLV